MDFRAGLIAQGREGYERAAAVPDSLRGSCRGHRRGRRLRGPDALPRGCRLLRLGRVRADHRRRRGLLRGLETVRSGSSGPPRRDRHGRGLRLRRR
ncbi:hypothetical protein ACWD3I_04220 [Streptomyces sp. NPDC002817]|uniref:hypothetical protein n=1 Tax=Streptomyces sp. NPDC088357 TaxID=3154655 RepID=UPI00342AFED4